MYVSFIFTYLHTSLRFTLWADFELKNDISFEKVFSLVVLTIVYMCNGQVVNSQIDTFSALQSRALSHHLSIKKK